MFHPPILIFLPLSADKTGLTYLKALCLNLKVKTFCVKSVSGKYVCVCHCRAPEGKIFPTLPVFHFKKDRNVNARKTVSLNDTHLQGFLLTLRLIKVLGIIIITIIMINNSNKKSVSTPKNIPSIGLRAHFIKQMVKEDFHSSQYDRLSNVTWGGGVRGGRGWWELS